MILLSSKVEREGGEGEAKFPGTTGCMYEIYEKDSLPGATST